VRLDQSDFTGVKMESPEFRCVSFLESGFDDAELINALFEHCNLEYVVWERLRAPRAVCVDTAFTGSVLIGVDFAGAIFKRALMADIRWEYADLRYANLSECVFHMGSSRSGLVESPFPSHGTRTGFYTDDFHDQTHKIPEEIRKASLRGANLEGADVISTDFYLVDLRDANYDEDQRRHFQRCGAIL